MSDEVSSADPPVRPKARKGKGSRRYFADPAKAAVWAEIRARTDWAADQQRKGFWITYLIRDPRFRDKKGQPGLPIYVGQTNDFAERVFSRFNGCEKEAIKLGKDCVEKRVADLLHLGIVATYQVLSYQPTHLSSLVSETNMALECWNRGYDLANNAKLQNGPGPRITRDDIPKRWIWDRFTLSEAAQDNILVEVRCAACRSALRISAERFRGTRRPPNKLKEIETDPMWNDEPCTDCGALGRRSLALHLA
jgi:hypothetical protein